MRGRGKSSTKCSRSGPAATPDTETMTSAVTFIRLNPSGRGSTVSGGWLTPPGMAIISSEVPKAADTSMKSSARGSSGRHCRTRAARPKNRPNTTTRRTAMPSHSPVVCSSGRATRAVVPPRPPRTYPTSSGARAGSRSCSARSAAASVGGMPSMWTTSSPGRRSASCAGEAGSTTRTITRLPLSRDRVRPVHGRSVARSSDTAT